MSAAGERVLIVDDSRDQLLLLELLLRNEGYQVLTATSGEQAWSLMQQQPTSLVVSDWVMPGMDGIELCQRIRDARFPHFVYFLLLTGRDDTASLVGGLNAGANDFLTKPLNPAELKARLQAGLRIVQLQRSLEEHNQRLSAALATIQRDIHSAAHMQRQLMPAHIEHGAVQCSWYLCPSHYLAGDLLDYFSLPDGRFVFYQLDIAGHGIPAALRSFALHNAVRSLHFNDSYRLDTPAQVIEYLNQRFQGEQGEFITLFYAQLQPASGVLRWVRAGHPCPFLLRASDGSVCELDHGGPPIGILPSLQWPEGEVQLAHGDRLFLHSDGVMECPDPEQQLFGSQRLAQLLQQHAGSELLATCEAVAQALQQWSAGPVVHDDVSLLALEYQMPMPTLTVR